MQAIVDWAVNLMAVIGPPGVALAILVETIFPPVPSEVFLPLAGFTATTGEFSAWSALAWATGGSVVGAFLLYWAGAVLGQRRLREIADRIPLAKATDVDKALSWFGRHGEASAFFGRMVPGVRSLISIPAGLQRMPLGKFALYTTAGSAIWNGVLIYAGVVLGDNYHLVEKYVSEYSTVVYVIVGIALLGVCGLLARRARRRGRAREADRRGTTR